MGKNKVVAKIWLAKAKDDLAFAKAGWQESKIASVACVLSQQAAEKALKSLLELENINIEVKKLFCTITILMFCLFFISYSNAGVYQSELKIAPVKVYKSMLDNFKNKRYEKVEKAIPFVEPVMNTIKARFGVDIQPEIKSALKARNNNFYITLEKLIFYDIWNIFTLIIKEGENQSPQELKLWYKMAYANYLLLSPVILQNKENFTLDRKIKKMFKETYLCLGSESSYGKKIPMDLRLFEERSDEIIENISMVFPEFNNEKGKHKNQIGIFWQHFDDCLCYYLELVFSDKCLKSVAK